ncbi:MAG TPA: polysaccharide biosynthesis C-terminal domain-containing protein, partial [Candidatus Kapabacteria bacterium]
MKEQLKALSKETLIYGASTVIGRFLNFLLMPFYVNVLNPTMYGVSASMYTYISFLTILYTCGLEAAYFRYASRGENEKRSDAEERRLFSGPFLFILAVGLVLSGAIFLFAPELVWPVFHDPKVNITKWVPEFTTILRISAIILLLDSLNFLPFAALRIDRRAKWFGVIRLTGIVLTLAFNFVFILEFHQGVVGIFYANLIASAAMMAMLSPTVIRRYKTPSFSKARQQTVPIRFKRLLSFGFTNVPAYLAAMMVQVIDRPIVQAFLGLAILGVYQANYRMGIIMMVFVGLFEYAWRPFFLREARTNDDRARQIFSRVFTYFMAIACLAFLALAIFLPDLLTVHLPFIHRAILKPDYRSGIPIIPVVLAAYIFQGMYTNFIAGIYIKEHNKVLPFVTGVGAIVNVGTNILLIPVLGIMGAALATLFAYMAMAGSLYWQAQKVYFIRYDWRRVGLVAAIVLIGFFIDYLFIDRISGRAEQAVCKLGLLIVVILLLFFTGFFSKGEIAALRAMLRAPGK